jgi:hypothetical protein
MPHEVVSRVSRTAEAAFLSERTIDHGNQCARQYFDQQVHAATAAIRA